MKQTREKCPIRIEFWTIHARVMSALESFFLLVRMLVHARFRKQVVLTRAKSTRARKEALLFQRNLAIHVGWLPANFSLLCCRRFTLKKLINGSNWISWECSLLTQKYFRLSLLSGKVSECGGLGKIFKFFKGNLGMSAFYSCILSYNFLTLFELSRSGQGLTI